MMIAYEILYTFHVYFSAVVTTRVVLYVIGGILRTGIRSRHTSK